VGEAASFASARQFAAFIGLTPRQHSSGGKPVMLGISKQGDGYLRRLFIHGARAVVRQVQAQRKAGERVADSWLVELLKRRPTNMAVVALANKNARIAWALLRHPQRRYCRDYSPVLARV